MVSGCIDLGCPSRDESRGVVISYPRSEGHGKVGK